MLLTNLEDHLIRVKDRITLGKYSAPKNNFDDGRSSDEVEGW